MSPRTVVIAPRFESWQAAARVLLRDGVAPADVAWTEGETTEVAGAGASTRVPRRFVELARQAAGASDPARWSVLYEAVWRIVRERRDLLDDSRDPLVRRLDALAAQARRESSRTELEAMRRVEQEDGGAARFVPAGGDLGGLASAARDCTGCPLHRHAIQTVFGRGPQDARTVLVGEQPGDQEDRRGAPFVGPAGEVLDRALAEAGLDRERLYVTNAVKHFKFVERGPRRIHQTPTLAEVAACRPWLDAELALIKPERLVCLGATAARAVFGPEFRLMQQRGRFLPTRWTPRTIATLHPSAVLRGQDDAEQQRLYRMLADDLTLVARG